MVRHHCHYWRSRISPQWLSELTPRCSSVSWQVVSQPTPTPLVSGISVFSLWQNDPCLFRASAVTRRWNRYRRRNKQTNKQTREVDVENEILPPLLPWIPPATHRLRGWRTAIVRWPQIPSSRVFRLSKSSHLGNVKKPGSYELI